MKRTPLFERHVALGATVGDFGGWEMPLWYPTGQIEEHKVTREACGLFDICHMGEFVVKGKDSLAFWQKVLSNNVEKLVDGQAQYNFMLNPDGGVVDDCIVYRYTAEHWMLVVNAGTQDGDFEWLKKNVFGDVTVENIGPQTGKLDLQGPAAPKIIADMIGRETIEGMKFFRFLPDVDLGGKKVILSRTGYTGEIGFEIYCNIDDTLALWNMLLEAGKKYGILPVGLGGRDTLRLEAGLPLHGHEIRPDVPAVGTPWSFAIDMNTDFIGKEALEKNEGSLFVYSVIVNGRRKPGDHAEVLFDDTPIGEMTSSILAVSLEKKPAGFIRVTKDLAIGDTVVLKNSRGKLFEGEVVATPLLKGTSRKKMSVMLDK